ncbi:MAG: ATP-grasp domain-containing protein [Bacillota bacterium]|nr:ATP-grasp domain-containing protein [Bacillota bacterium]
MNFIFISPHFPKTYWNFCDRLKRNGVNVLGIGDASYNSLDEELKQSLTEYYYVQNMQDYDQMYRAVAYFAFKYGKIDWIESNNEFWLEQDAKLRTDFHVQTGIQDDAIGFIKEKALMKEIYQSANIPTARQHVISTLEAAYSFIEKVGYPVIVKPNIGVGATNIWKLENHQDLENFFNNLPSVSYVMEEFIEGDIYSYDAIYNSAYEPLFENMTVWPPSIADIVTKDLDLMYYTCPEVHPSLRKLGRACVKAFGAFSRFVHLEFFRLKKARKGLGEVGDFVALEVNMRPPGGYTPDMMNFAHSSDVYQIWADMVAFDQNYKESGKEKYYCVYASRKDGHVYQRTHAQILETYRANLVMQEEMPEMNWPQMGRYMYTAKLKNIEEVEAFVRFVQG